MAFVVRHVVVHFAGCVRETGREERLRGSGADGILATDALVAVFYTTPAAFRVRAYSPFNQTITMSAVRASSIVYLGPDRLLTYIAHRLTQ